MKDGRIRGYMGFGAVCCLESWLMLISLILRKYFTIPTRFQRITKQKVERFGYLGDGCRLARRCGPAGLKRDVKDIISAGKTVGMERTRG